MDILFKKAIAFSVMTLAAGVSVGTVISIPDLISYKRRKMNIQYYENVSKARSDLMKELLKEKLVKDHDEAVEYATKTITIDENES